MKPKTKLQHRVVSLSEKLPPITDKQMEYGIEKGLVNCYYKSRKTFYCLECGHSWKENLSNLILDVTGCTCPECGKDLQRSNNNSCYYGIMTTKEEFQVLRIFWIEKKYTKGHPAYNLTVEVMQHWIDANGNVTTMSKNVNALSRYFDQWILSSDLEVRPKQFQNCPRYTIKPFVIYPIRKVLPELKRNGFSGYFHGFVPQKLFSLLLREPKAETLIKAGQDSILAFLDYKSDEVFRYWPSVKICLRNRYYVTDAAMYFDYLHLLEHFGRDLKNAHYVCPDNLRKAHDRLVEKKAERERKKSLEEKRLRMEQDNAEYQKQKGSFFGLSFKSGNITVEPLKSVQEFDIEGDMLKHCVFQGNYYKNENSLVFSAQVNGERTETVEFSLKNLQVVQCYGLKNKETEYHEQIVSLVNQNAPKIRKIMQKAVSV